MDLTQVILAFIALLSTLGTVALPIILKRSHNKTRGMASEESRVIGERIGKMESAITGLTTEMHATTRTTQGLHLLDVIEHRPQCWETIRQLYAQYQASGGNGHVQRVVEQWEQDYGQDLDRGEVPQALLKPNDNG